MLLEEIIDSFSLSKKHSKTTAKIALLLFKKLLPYFPILEEYNNEEDLFLLEAGARLHDIGVYFEKKYGISHNKAGAKYIFQNPPEEIKEENKGILACLIRYHRKSLPSLKHKIYFSLSNEDKEKLNRLAPLIRLADALDYSHKNLIEDFEILYNDEEKILTLNFPLNIMLKKPFIKAFSRKKDFFEAVYDVKIKLGTLEC